MKTRPFVHGIVTWFFGLACTISMACADEPFERVKLGESAGYIVPKEYAEKPDSHAIDVVMDVLFADSKTVGYWTPTTSQVLGAEKASRRFIRAGISDPKQAFADVAEHPEKFPPEALKKGGEELVLVDHNYGKYVCQFWGVLFGGKKLILCSYYIPDFPPEFKLDPASQVIAINDGGYTVWQVIYNVGSKRCTQLNINGPWAGQ